MGLYLLKFKNKISAWFILAISVGLMADPLFATTCRTIGNTCQEYFSLPFLLHAIESTLTATGFFVLAVYDSWKRKKLVSLGFVIFQFAYGALFLSQLAGKDSFETASQMIYQTAILVWMAWLCRDLVVESNFTTSGTEKRLATRLVAAWAFFNGILAIVISLAHISLLGRIRGLYFSGDSAWLAQHGVIVGVIMLYLSRHLARGERRARQIFLVLSGIETLKYSTISPDPGIMLVYLATFLVLFVLRDDFDRGSIVMTWRLKLRDLYFLVAGLVISAFAALLVLDRDNRVSTITRRAFDHFSDYVVRDHPITHRHLPSALLAHTISAFLLASLATVLWVLFRPYKISASYSDPARIQQLLQRYSRSSEDYFKFWPSDKSYFWSKNNSGFIAYRRAGSTVFALADPISASPAQLIKDFNDWARRHRLKACYLPVYSRSLKMYEQAGLESLQIGSSALVNIDDFLDRTSKGKWWRWRLNKSTKAGYHYQSSVPPHSDAFMNELAIVSNAWLTTAGHKERAFALGYFDPNYLQQCTIHYLTDDQQRIVAFTNQLPSFNSQPIMTIDLLRYLPGSDSMAYLLYKTIESGQGHYRTFDLGFVPFANAKGPVLRVAKAISSEWFSSKGLEQFKNKFEPVWEPNYLVYEGDLVDLAAVALNLEKAMAVSPPTLTSSGERTSLKD